MASHHFFGYLEKVRASIVANSDHSGCGKICLDVLIE